MQTSTSVLQSIGKQMIPVRNLAIGCVGKVVVTYITVGIHDINVKGAAIGTLFAYFIAMTLNDISVKKYTGVTHNIGIAYFRPALAAIAMAIWAFAIYNGLSIVLSGISPHKAIAISVGISVISSIPIYVIMIFAVKAISLEELRYFPLGEKLEKVVKIFIRG